MQEGCQGYRPRWGGGGFSGLKAVNPPPPPLLTFDGCSTVSSPPFPSLVIELIMMTTKLTITSYLQFISREKLFSENTIYNSFRLKNNKKRLNFY